MKVQLDKSKYSTVGKSSCLVLVQWMKGQPRTVNPCLFKSCIALVHSYVCLGCACGWMSEVDLRPPSPVICKSHEL